MLEKGPYKIEVRGMKVEGFGGISYHHVWGAKKMYKEFLRSKFRELAKELGLKLVDEVDVDAVEEEEIEVDTEQVIEDDLDELAQEIGLGPLTVVRGVPHSAGHVAGDSPGHAAGDVETVGLSQLMQAMSIQASAGSRIQRLALNKVIETDFEFVKGGEDNG